MTYTSVELWVPPRWPAHSLFLAEWLWAGYLALCNKGETLSLC